MLEDIEKNVTAMMGSKHYVDISLGLRRYAPWLDFGRLFEYTLCNTDSTVPYRIDYAAPRISLCANFLVQKEDLTRVTTFALVQLHDHLRNKGPWKTCAGYGCTITRATILSEMCPQVATRGTCLLTTIQTGMSGFPGCQGRPLAQEAEEAFQRCHMDRSPFGLL